MFKRVGIFILIALLIGAGLYHRRPPRTEDYLVDPTARLDPALHYRITVWIALPVIATAEAYRSDILQVLADFSALEGSITVETLFVADHLLKERLAAALTAGTPPDLVLDTAEAQINYGELQLPLGRYLTKLEKENYSPSSLAQASFRGAQLGLPVGFSPRVFLASTGVLQTAGLSLENIILHGWTWEQFLQSVAASTSKARPGLVLTNVGTPLLQTLAASLGTPSPWDSEGRLNWGEETLLALATIGHQLARTQSGAEPSSATENALALFLNGKAALIGPLNPPLTTWLHHEARARKLTLSVLPVPSLQGGAFTDMRSINLVAFRQRSRQRPDHERMVAELAKYVAPELGQVLGEHLSFIPPHATSTPRTDIPWQSEGEAATNMAFALRTPYRLGGEGAEKMADWEAALEPLWLSLMKGELSPTDFSQQAHSVLEQLGP